MPPTEPPTPRTVLIIGGSLAALTHALTLLSLPPPQRPQQITLLERSPSHLLHNQGAGIVASPDVQTFFSEYVKPGREIAVQSKLRQYLQRDGGVVEGSVEARGQRMVSWDGVFNLLRARVDGGSGEGYVQGLPALEGVGEGGEVGYLNGCTVTGVDDAGEEGVRVTYTHSEHSEPQTATADMVIAADGASSTVRRLLRPDIERTYAGYVAWRGTVPETSLSSSASETFVENFTFYHATGTQALGYLIPGSNGTIEPGKRLFNWVWYCNYPKDSPELSELMTDINGKRHAVTLPVGKMREDVWTKQRKHAEEVLPPQFAEAVHKTTQPFIQAVMDVLCPENSFMHGKVLLVGDALAGFRPHTAASTGQAAYDALQLGMWLRGEIGREEYGRRVREFAGRVHRLGVELGERSQFGKHPLDGGR